MGQDGNMTARLPLFPALAAALLFACCQQDVVVPQRLHPMPGSGAAQVHPASERPLWTASVQDAGEHVPADYGDFTCMASYPRTCKVWRDVGQLRAKGRRHVEIDLARQRGIFIVDGRVAMDFPVCTGTKRKPTPTGSFRITQKDADHVSNIYDVPMPYFMRLTDYGVGMHVGDVFRSPASHGCIRLTREACVPLYRHAPSGTRVVIRRSGWQGETERAIRATMCEGGDAAGGAQARQLASSEG